MSESSFFITHNYFRNTIAFTGSMRVMTKVGIIKTNTTKEIVARFNNKITHQLRLIGTVFM